MGTDGPAGLRVRFFRLLYGRNWGKRNICLLSEPLFIWKHLVLRCNITWVAHGGVRGVLQLTRYKSGDHIVISLFCRKSRSVLVRFIILPSSSPCRSHLSRYVVCVIFALTFTGPNVKGEFCIYFKISVLNVYIKCGFAPWPLAILLQHLGSFLAQ